MPVTDISPRFILAKEDFLAVTDMVNAAIYMAVIAVHMAAIDTCSGDINIFAVEIVISEEVIEAVLL